MAIQPTAAQNSILMLNVAMFGQAAGTTAMAAALPTFVDGNTYAQQLVTTSDAYKILSAEQAFTKVINNVSAGTGVTAADVEALAKGMVPFVDAGLTVGATINLLTAFLYQNAGQLTNIWNNASTQLLNKTTGASYYTLDQNNAAASADAIANISYRTGTDATSVSFQLTTANETFIGGAGADTFYAVVGNNVGTQDQTTLNSGDSMAGGENNDIMYVNMLNNYNGGAMIHGIETLRLGTAGNVIFDYNVNEGQPQVADVTTLVADYINAGETMNITNIIKTDGVLPTLSWQNDSATQAAGTFGATYRAAQVSGGDDNQAVQLSNVNAGVLNIGNGIETITIESTGAAATNTLNNSNNVDGNPADIVSGSNDGVNDNGTLRTVVVTGTKGFGRAATVDTNDVAGEANFGLTNRAANGANDLGLTNTIASASNLSSVAATTTKIDASNNSGGVAMRFDPRVDGAAVNVTFVGGKGNDYIETNRGNVSLTGGEGTDTFAFINSGLTDFDFGSADVVTGGVETTDVIQLGVNGVGTVVANTTEFNNKTQIEVLDLRANRSTVTLADAFVTSSDSGTMQVRTDKIIQASDTSTANTAPSFAANNRALEDNSVNVVVLTQLAENRAVEFIGGSGSDRLVVNNASANQYTKLDGGSNTGTAATGAANSVDSLTVVNTARLDTNDVLNIKGFEILNLVETDIANNIFNIDFSETFLLNNTTTAIPLYVTSVTNTYGTRLGTVGAAGDVVNIEVSDLLTGGVIKPTLANRVINLQDVIAAVGAANVVFLNNGVQIGTAAAVPAVLAANINTATAPTAAILANVPGAVVAPTATFTLAAGGTYTAAAGVDTTFNSTIANLVGTTATGNTGVDTLVMQDAGAVVIPATITAMNAITLANGVNSLTGAVATGATAITGGTGADTLVVGLGENISGIALSSIETLQLAGNATMTVAQHNASAIVATPAAQKVTFTTAGTFTASTLFGAVGVEEYALFNGTNNVTLSLNDGVTAIQTITGGTGADTINTTVANAVQHNFDGGASTDTVNITGGMTAALTVTTAGAGAAAMGVTGLEALTISGASTAKALTLVSAVLGDFATINASGVTGGGISITTTGLTAATNRTITLTAGNDTITDLKGTVNTLTVDFGAGVTDTVSDLAVASGGLFTIKAAATAGSTHLVNFAATTANLVTGVATGTLLDFSGDVTAIAVRAIGAAGVNVAGQVIIDNVTAVADTAILWDVDGNGAYSAGDVQIYLVGQAYTGATAAIVGGNLQL